MRKVEERTINAIQNRKDYTEGNTKVRCFKDGSEVCVTLHDNLIFKIIDGVPDFPYRGRWMYSNTTKSRIRAIAYGLGIPKPEGY